MGIHDIDTLKVQPVTTLPDAVPVTGRGPWARVVASADDRIRLYVMPLESSEGATLAEAARTREAASKQVDAITRFDGRDQLIGSVLLVNGTFRLAVIDALDLKLAGMRDATAHGAVITGEELFGDKPTDIVEFYVNRFDNEDLDGPSLKQFGADVFEEAGRSRGFRGRASSKNAALEAMAAGLALSTIDTAKARHNAIGRVGDDARSMMQRYARAPNYWNRSWGKIKASATGLPSAPRSPRSDAPFLKALRGIDKPEDFQFIASFMTLEAKRLYVRSAFPRLWDSWGQRSRGTGAELAPMVPLPVFRLPAGSKVAELLVDINSYIDDVRDLTMLADPSVKLFANPQYDAELREGIRARLNDLELARERALARGH